MFGQGISKTGEIIDMGVELNVIQKSGSWFSYDTTKLGQGRDSVKQLLVDNPTAENLYNKRSYFLRRRIIPNKDCGYNERYSEACSD